MHSPSRRAFLRGNKSPQTPWKQFCQRLRRVVSGEFVELQSTHATEAARLTVQHATDIHHVRALCGEYGVVLCLDGLTMPTRHHGQPVVWVRPGQGLASFKRLAGTRDRWFVQPGCTLGELSDAGLDQLADLPPAMTVAAWLADRTLSDYAIGQTFRSGLEHVSLLLADGNVANLGPFAIQNTKPLDGLRLQQLVPALFRLTADPDVRACLEARFWPLRYRLDALMADHGQVQNLAHLCLGHGGDLGWLEWAVIDATQLSPGCGQATRFGSAQEGPDSRDHVADVIDRKVKDLFDPGHVFSAYGQDLYSRVRKVP